MTFAAQEVAGARIGEAVRRWLATLDPSQLARAVLSFDTDERFAWDYVPGTRQGLSLGDMTSIQREAAMAVVGASLSERGSGEVAAVIALEPILGELERQAGKPGWAERESDRYWFAVFGDPDDGSPWSWRIGGHHVAIHLTVGSDGSVVGSAPSFLGANPASVPSGRFSGHRALVGEEGLARTMLAALSPEQRAVAVVDPIAPPDIQSGSGPRADLRAIPSGIRHDQLDAVEGAHLERLVRHYLDRAAPEIAEAEWDRVLEAGLASVTFAWAGPDAPGQGHYYAVRGAGFLIEYDNTQNGANHIHSVWRDLTNDWGEDLLAAHYRRGHGTSG